MSERRIKCHFCREVLDELVYYTSVNRIIKNDYTIEEMTTLYDGRKVYTCKDCSRKVKDSDTDSA